MEKNCQISFVWFGFAKEPFKATRTGNRIRGRHSQEPRVGCVSVIKKEGPKGCSRRSGHFSRGWKGNTSYSRPFARTLSLVGHPLSAAKRSSKGDPLTFPTSGHSLAMRKTRKTSAYGGSGRKNVVRGSGKGKRKAKVEREVEGWNQKEE